jgi:hypothetical protein
MNTLINESLKVIAILTLTFLFVGYTSAQITINIPKIPKWPKGDKTKEIADTTGKTNGNTGVNTDVQTESNNTKTTTGDFCTTDMMVGVYMKDIETTRKQAEEYRPGARDYYVQDFSDRQNIYLKASLSPSRRKEWLGTWPANIVNCITPALDNLAAIAKKTLPTYVPAGFALGTPAELKVLRTGVNDLAQATVFKVGISSPNWLISKDSYNFPTARYKYGVIWAKYPGLDDGFCRIIYVNLVQDYAGGGTYGASYGNFIKSEFAGCPPGK